MKKLLGILVVLTLSAVMAGCHHPKMEILMKGNLLTSILF